MSGQASHYGDETHSLACKRPLKLATVLLIPARPGGGGGEAGLSTVSRMRVEVGVARKTAWKEDFKKTVSLLNLGEAIIFKLQLSSSTFL